MAEARLKVIYGHLVPGAGIYIIISCILCLPIWACPSADIVTWESRSARFQCGLCTVL